MAAGEEFMPCSRLVYADLSAGRIELWLTTVKNHGVFLGTRVLCLRFPCRVICHCMHRGMQVVQFGQENHHLSKCVIIYSECTQAQMLATGWN